MRKSTVCSIFGREPRATALCAPEVCSTAPPASRGAVAGLGFWGGFGGVLPVFRGVLRFRAGGVLLRLCFYN
jgi:hypothetical protein